MKKTLIKDATLINEGEIKTGSLLIEGEKIAEIYYNDLPNWLLNDTTIEKIDAQGMWLMPGMIDDQVHFREPGFTYKGNIATESAAAVAGGVTSFMDMPNTNPQTTTQEALDWKLERAAESSFANYGFYLGATNTNIQDVVSIDTSRCCGIKLFMGSSTGNMLVDNKESLTRLFAQSPLLIAAHCEKEEIIRSNIAYYKSLYGDNLPISFHPLIRSEEACYASSAQAVELATKNNGRLHILHLSTAKELSLLSNRPLAEKKITAEVCVHHLYFSNNDYPYLGNRIKWNPAIKTEQDRKALLSGLKENKVDIIATDHAPHLWKEKEGYCLQAASGGPLLQHSLLAMLELYEKEEITLTDIVTKMAHAPAELFSVKDRGYLRKGYYADLVLIKPHTTQSVTPANIYSLCGWSPFENHTFSNKIAYTFVNGNIAYKDGIVENKYRGQPLTYNR